MTLFWIYLKSYTKYVASNTSPLSNLTSNTEDKSVLESRKRQINWYGDKTINICNDSIKSICNTCTNKVIKLSVCKDCKKEYSKSFINIYISNRYLKKKKSCKCKILCVEEKKLPLYCVLFDYIHTAFSLIKVDYFQ